MLIDVARALAAVELLLLRFPDSEAAVWKLFLGTLDSSASRHYFGVDGVLFLMEIDDS